MTTTTTTLSLLMALFLMVSSVNAWLPAPHCAPAPSSTALFVRSGIDGWQCCWGYGWQECCSGSIVSGSSLQPVQTPSRCKLPDGPKALPAADHQVTLVETNLPTLNPNGAVAHEDALYCFPASCPLVAGSSNDVNSVVLLECNFCKSTHDLNTGAKLESNNKPKGLFGGVVNTLLSSSAVNNGPLTLYQLGQSENGKDLYIDPTPQRQ